MPFPNSPADYSIEELDALQNTVAVSARTKNVDYVLSVFNYLLPKLIKEFPAVFGDNKFTQADFLWAGTLEFILYVLQLNSIQ